MDYTVLLQAVSTVGFPIVMCGAMFWKMTEDSKDHKEEVQQLTEAINNNTVALSKLVEHFGNGGD